MIDRGLLNYPEQLAVRLSKMERDIKRNSGKSSNCSKMALPVVKWSSTLNTGSASNKKFRITIRSGMQWAYASLIIWSRYAPLMFLNIETDGNGDISRVRRSDETTMASYYGMTWDASARTITFNAPRTYDEMKIGEFITSQDRWNSPYVVDFQMI